ncbi:sensor domain-containing diguanylate cyclase [Candidatus Sulfurimonas baltica]|uniref:diguanylate cyclase n=1 Tax=Candidatus Sulfurimonas baltica TaxID=2740404 RepID=A0A7S7LTE1_9BACT|nr:sensor domain-containing diguanylate cyclase [Candidatus Sulfurimonas baltica]QOY50930.1 GGDEF domain-containing protein [Candidatus Sulfurimonas baltica]
MASKLFSELIVTPIIVNDLATLDNTVNSFVSIKNVIAVKIMNNNNIVLSHKNDENPTYKNIFENNKEILHLNERTLVLKLLDIKIDDDIIAKAKIIFEITDSLRMQERNKNVTFIMMILEIIVIILVAYLIGSSLIRRLSVLTHSAEEIAENNQVTIPNIDNYKDEVSILANTLQLMQNKINKRSDELKKYIQLVNENILISRTDLNGIITDVSEALCEVSGFSKEELIGKTHAVIKHPDTLISEHENLWKTISKGNEWHADVKNKTKDGGFFWADSSIYPDYDYNQNIIGYYAIRHDITSKKEIEKLSITDGLTKLYNRRYFDNMFDEEINRAKRDRKIFCLLSLDIDFFKKYNDTYGHPEGDQVLITIARVLNSHMKRAGDIAFRIGGEEFSAIFVEKNEKNVYTFTENIRQDIENQQIQHIENTSSNFVTASFGVIYIDFSKNNNAETNREVLYKEADNQLYKAKETGRNKVVIKACN